MNAEIRVISYRPARVSLVRPIFAAALFVSAALLFWVQPLIAKMLLPLLGGAPAVWNTCMVFFQATLLAGYGYSVMMGRTSLARQIVTHGVILLIAGLFLPFVVSEVMVESFTGQINPTPGLLFLLMVSVGPPLFALSATAPLLQAWFSRSDHESAHDPYYLYSVSNAGSILTLIAFPFFLERAIPLRTQSTAWAAGYFLLVCLILICGFTVKQRSSVRGETVTKDTDLVLTNQIRLKWLLLSFTPSSLMLGLTTYISTDLASVPLLWIIPLTIYLVTFVLAFARKELIPLRLVSLIIPALVVLMGCVFVLKYSAPFALVLSIHVLFFFLAAFVCHRKLANKRPAVSKLSEFYLWVAVGGVLGGLFNAVAAPLIFSTPVEYPIVVVLACCLGVVKKGGQTTNRWRQLALPVAVFLLCVGLARAIPPLSLDDQLSDSIVILFPLLIAYMIAGRRPLNFGLAVAALMLGTGSYLKANQQVLITERNFFGVWKVTQDTLEGEQYNNLIHGSTVHGVQFLAPEKKCVATSYYHRSGPLGEIFEAYDSKQSSNYIAAVGLGTGSIGTYSKREQQWDFYEIDPDVVALAQNRQFFSFLSDCTEAGYRIVLGDARLTLSNASANRYGLVVVDAFSSDSIPTHLLTWQALDVYLSKTASDGLIAFHISNRYLNLEPVLAGLANRAGVSARIWDDNAFSLSDGKFASIWVVMGRTDAALGTLANNPKWRALNGNVVWSDDFSNILDLFR